MVLAEMNQNIQEHLEKDAQKQELLKPFTLESM